MSSFAERLTGQKMSANNDPDGGGRRAAAIKSVSRKIETMKADIARGMGDPAKLAQWEAQLADLNDPAKPVK